MSSAVHDQLSLPAALALPGVTHRRVEAGRLRLHVAEAGPPDGPLVLLLHGFPEFWWSWRHQLTGLAAAGCRVVAPDMPGYGWSDAPDDGYDVATLSADVRALVRVLAVERGTRDSEVTVCGHDWGGAVAWSYAALHPNALARLAILNAPHLLAFEKALVALPVQAAKSWYIAAFQCKGLVESLMRATPEALLAKTLYRAAGRRDAFTRSDVQQYALAHTRPHVPEAALAYYRSIAANFALRDELARPIAVPVRVLWGERDPALDRRLTEFARPHVTGELSVRWFPDAGHWLQQEEPAAVTEELAAFAAGELLAP
jgi:pimeloyl-ACP methyl ester carboxylesterase